MEEDENNFRRIWHKGWGSHWLLQKGEGLSHATYEKESHSRTEEVEQKEEKLIDYISSPKYVDVSRSPKNDEVEATWEVEESSIVVVVEETMADGNMEAPAEVIEAKVAVHIVALAILPIYEVSPTVNVDNKPYANSTATVKIQNCWEVQ